MDKTNKPEINTVRSVERSLDILTCFIDKNELSLTEISKLVSLHKSTVYRLLNTLEGKGFLIKNITTEKYCLGYKIWELSTNMVAIDELSNIFLQEMKNLRDILNETVSLYVRNKYERIRIQSVESNQSLRRVAPIGEHLPLYVGASSKILIAYEKEKIQNDIFKYLESVQKINIESFKKIVDDVRISGYATSFEERAVGAVAIACPIFNSQNKLIAALSISGPVNRLTKEKLDEIAPILKETCAELSKKS